MVLYPITSVLEMPNLIEQVKRTTEDVLFGMYVSNQTEIETMVDNTAKLVSSLEQSTSKVVEQQTKQNDTLDKILKVSNEQFKTTTAQLDNVIKTLDKMLTYQNDLISILGSKLKVSIESIPTQDAIVVTNNVLHPALAVAFLPVTQ